MLINAQGVRVNPPFLIGGIRHPDNIESVWNDAQLAAIGLSRSTPPAPTVNLAEYAADRRFGVETGGVIVNGVAVATDRDSQAMISGAYAYIQKRPTSAIKFKASSGFVTLDAATVEAIALAVGDHVQACFAKEAEVLAGVAGGSITSTAQIDAAFALVT